MVGEIVLTTEDLAARLRRSPKTIRADATRAPHKLPPRLRLPGSTRLVWLESDVDNWLREHRG